MLRTVIAVASLALAAAAHAGEAGKVIFVAGDAQVLGQPALEGAAVQEGQMLQTGADGFLYVKTADNGLFILRPNSKARIVTYQIDDKNPENTRVKLELISGVARSKSGDAVKRARQNFRFNTPVAAIGVRGTDFTVFTDEATSRVSVLSGGVVVTGFGDACRPDGIGPCEGVFSRELSAAQRGKVLQVQRGAQAPTEISSESVLQGQPANPAGAPVAGAAAGAMTPAEQTVNTRKTEQLANDLASKVPSGGGKPTDPVTGQPGAGDGSTEPVPPVVPVIPDPTPPVVVPEPPVKQAGIVWGRWQAVNGLPTDFNLELEWGKNQLVALSGYYGILRTPGQSYVTPERGNVGFKLADSEAFVTTNYGYASNAVVANLSNGKLDVDFGNKSFTTSFDAATLKENFSFRGDGVVTSDGGLYGGVNGRANYVNVQGLLSNDKGGAAAYIFDGQIDERRRINGAAYWTPIKQ